ncbi:putative baseplate assembly protein [Streptomyces sp. NPDC019443]|uniref:putative baseplate assembly protein n=1 Tax=Streptomyces sp. NPDC019443 TaxID=3365061 RepID=UPI0037A44DFF
MTNQPGLDALVHRMGTHASFFETMRSRLAALLPDLHTRDLDDPAIAFLDAWAVVADVLTFYQERITNEGYLRTATEWRSVAELAALVGHRPRPGVAASVFLAFTLEDGYRGEIPPGTRAQSMPAPGELPQPYETANALMARAEWNLLRPRLTRPQALMSDLIPDPKEPEPGKPPPKVYLAGTRTGLEANDALLVVLAENRESLFRVAAVAPDSAADRTTVEVTPWGRVFAAPKEGAPATGTLTIGTPATGEPVDRLRRIIDNALALQAGERPGRTWRETAELLRRVRAGLDHPVALTDLHVLLERQVLPVLREKQAAAVRNRNAAHLRARFAGVLPPLESLVADLANRPTRLPGFGGLAELAGALGKPASVPPSDARRMPRNPRDTYAATGDAVPRLLAAVRPELGPVLYEAWRNLPRTPRPTDQVYALRTRARLFGHNAPPRAAEKFTVSFPPTHGSEALLTFQVTVAGHTIAVRAATGTTTVTRFEAAAETIETTLSGFQELGPAPVAVVVLKQRRVTVTAHLRPSAPLNVVCAGSDPTTVVREVSDDVIGAVGEPPDLRVSGEIQAEFPLREQPRTLTLDASYPQILPGSWVAVDKPGPRTHDNPVIARVLEVRETTRADYGISTAGTQLELDREWLRRDENSFALVRGTTVHARSEPLPRAQAPLDPVAEAICGDRIELDGLYEGLEPGRRVVVSGERTDVPGVTGLPAAEVALLAGVEQVARDDLPGETTHSVLRLANPLAYCYRRDTAKIYGNVADASQGETRTEVLGSGDASAASQRFGLRQSPLTFVAAGTPSGTESTLRVRVGEVLWHETGSPAEAAPTDHSYSTATDDERRTTVLFGDGRRGARLPTGTENVAAVYRTGIGRSGNVPTGRISLLATRPLGVREVVNPVPATGGADPDGRELTRRNARLGVTALDRLVSVRDHEDFARTFAGIGKAAAVLLSDGRRQLVHVTIAGADDIPIAPSSDLYAGLVRAFHRFGDPQLPVQLAVREQLALVVGGRVRVAPDYRWESVEPRVRTALLEAFGFERRELGQDALLSEALKVIQGVDGVDFVDIDTFTAVDETDLFASLARDDGLYGLLRRRQRVITERARTDRCATDPARRVRPAQLAVLDPRIPDTLILTEHTP